MTDYRWAAVPLHRVHAGMWRPHSDDAAELHAKLHRPVSGQDSPIFCFGNGGVDGPVVVAVDGMDRGVSESSSDRGGPWAIIVDLVGTPGVERFAGDAKDWNHGWLSCGAGAESVELFSHEGAVGLAEKWLVVLVIAQEWALLDVAADLAELNTNYGLRKVTDRGAAADVASLADSFRLRKGRLWWTKVSSDINLQRAYTQLQEQRGCQALHAQIMEEIALWRDHVATAQSQALNQRMMQLTLVTVATGIVSVVATIASASGSGQALAWSVATVALGLGLALRAGVLAKPSRVRQLLRGPSRDTAGRARSWRERAKRVGSAREVRADS